MSEQEQMTDLEFMSNPERWPHDNMLPLKNRQRRRDNVTPAFGTLVATGLPSQYIWYEGVIMFASAHENQKYMQSSRVLYTSDLQKELIDKGWEVD